MRHGGAVEREARGAYRFWLESLDQDAVEQRDKGLDRLESRLGSLRDAAHPRVVYVLAKRPRARRPRCTHHFSYANEARIRKK